MADQEPLTTVEQVRQWSGMKEGRHKEILQQVVDAVNAVVPSWIDPPFTDAHKMGATMLAARVYRRKNSPAGVEALGELGPVYVSRNDPDLAMLLGLHNYRVPKVG